MIKRGDTVVAVKEPGVGPTGLPLQRPAVGEVYTVTRVYESNYGWGVQLEGLDHRPYNGYLYIVEPQNPLGALPGIYFRKVQHVNIKQVARKAAKRRVREVEGV